MKKIKLLIKISTFTAQLFPNTSVALYFDDKFAGLVVKKQFTPKSPEERNGGLIEWRTSPSEVKPSSYNTRIILPQMNVEDNLPVDGTEILQKIYLSQNI